MCKWSSFLASQFKTKKLSDFLLQVTLETVAVFLTLLQDRHLQVRWIWWAQKNLKMKCELHLSSREWMSAPCNISTYKNANGSLQNTLMHNLHILARKFKVLLIERAKRARRQLSTLDKVTLCYSLIKCYYVNTRVQKIR